MADISSGSEAIGRTNPYRKVWIWAAWLGLALLLWFFLKDIPLREAWLAIRGLKVWNMAVLIAVNLFILLLFGLRWWLILRIFGQRLPILSIVGYRIASFGVSYFTPGPQIGGEPLQVILLQRHSVPATTAVTSVLFDKMLELLANFIFLLFGLLTALLSGLIQQEISPWVWAAFSALILLPVGHLGMLRVGKYPLTGIAARLRRMTASRILDKPVRFLSEGEALIGDFLRRRPDAFALVLFISGFLWVVSVVEFWMMLKFLGVQASWAQTITILSAGRLAFLLGVPGGIGTLEASMVLVSQAAGLSAAVGLAAGLVIHLRDIVIGLFGLWVAGWSSRSSIKG